MTRDPRDEGPPERSGVAGPAGTGAPGLPSTPVGGAPADEPAGAPGAPPAGGPPTVVAVRPAPWFKRFAKLWGFALFIVVVAYLFRAVLLPFVFAVTLAYVMAPAVNRLSGIRVGRGTLPRGLAVIVLYVGGIAILSLFLSAFLPRLSGDFARLASEAPRLWQRVQHEWTPRAARWLEGRFPSLAPPQEPPRDETAAPFVQLPPPPGTVLTVTPMASGDWAITLPEEGLELERIDATRLVVRPREERPPRRLEDVLRDRLRRAVAGLEGQLSELIRLGQAVVTGLVTLIMQAVLVLMIAAFILIDLDRLHRFARGTIPERYRGDYDTIVTGIDRGLNGVIRGQILICLVNGVLTYIGLLIFQVKYGLLLAAIAAIMSLIPIFGSILSSIPIVSIALVSSPAGVDFVRATFVLLWILGIHFLEGNFLNPKIMGSSARMHPVLVIFALIAGEHTYGLVGALLAVPAASIIQTLFLYFRSRAWRSEATAAPAAPAR